MGMFGGSREVVFDAGRRSRRGRIPAWAVSAMIGLGLGSAGLAWVQDRFGPPRLTTSDALRMTAERAQAVSARDAAERRERDTRKSLQGELDAAVAELGRTRHLLETRAQAAAGTDTTIAHLERELALYESVIPADPRGNPIGVRAARLARDGAGLAYHVLLSRGEAMTVPFVGLVQFVVSGQGVGGRSETVTLPAIPVRIDQHLHLTGRQELPRGFDPRRTQVQVLEKVAGSSVGRRVVNVQ